MAIKLYGLVEALLQFSTTANSRGRVCCEGCVNWKKKDGNFSTSATFLETTFHAALLPVRLVCPQLLLLVLYPYDMRDRSNTAALLCESQTLNTPRQNPPAILQVASWAKTQPPSKLPGYGMLP